MQEGLGSWAGEGCRTPPLVASIIKDRIKAKQHCAWDREWGLCFGEEIRVLEVPPIAKLNSELVSIINILPLLSSQVAVSL